jgi:hypothetical protein
MRISIFFILFLGLAAASAARAADDLPDVRICNWVMSRHRLPDRVATSYAVENDGRTSVSDARIRAVFLDSAGKSVMDSPLPEYRLDGLNPGQSKNVSVVNNLVPVFSSFELRLEGTHNGKPFKMRFFANSPFAAPVFMPDTPSGNAPNLMLIGQELATNKILDLTVKNMGLVDAKNVKVVVKFFNNGKPSGRTIEQPLDSSGAIVPGGKDKKFKVALTGIPAQYDRYNVALKYEGRPAEAALSGVPFTGGPVVELGEIDFKRVDKSPAALTISGRARNGLDKPVSEIKARFTFDVLVPAARKDDPPVSQRRDFEAPIPVKSLDPGQFAPFSVAVDNIGVLDGFEYGLTYALAPGGPPIDDNKSAVDGGGDKPKAGDFVIQGVPALKEKDVELDSISVVRNSKGAVEFTATVLNTGKQSLPGKLIVTIEGLKRQEDKTAVFTLTASVDKLAAGAKENVRASAVDVPAFSFVRYGFNWETAPGVKRPVPRNKE